MKCSIQSENTRSDVQIEWYAVHRHARQITQPLDAHEKKNRCPKKIPETAYHNFWRHYCRLCRKGTENISEHKDYCSKHRNRTNYTNQDIDRYWIHHQQP